MLQGTVLARFTVITGLGSLARGWANELQQRNLPCPRARSLDSHPSHVKLLSPGANADLPIAICNGANSFAPARNNSKNGA